MGMLWRDDGQVLTSALVFEVANQWRNEKLNVICNRQGKENYITVGLSKQFVLC